ncbi:MAG: hypothetical protein A2V90_07420 [Gammaproteobacteria bacterium RBG_16_57_12]|nr:MAG: hypothetical protein A2V90_07420 [Gammaproteobacteria bacterium RBG_16_57_12]
MTTIRQLLPRTVIIFGLVSLLNDAASEMIAPLLPLFLTATLGAGPMVVGLIEGVAEATASLLKLVSGWLADRGWNPKRMVLGGYLLSNITRPLIGLAFSWSWVLVLRFSDRIGKGLRTSPRDALIAAAVDETVRGRAFGFHRAMDHAGAVIGPVIAFFLLQTGMDLRTVFLISIIPGVITIILLSAGLPDSPVVIPVNNRPRLDWRSLDPKLRNLILAAGCLAFAAAPEVFLVLWAQSHGLEIVWIPLLWAAAHLVKMLISIPMGHLSDRYGRTPIVIGGWSARIILLILLAIINDGQLLIWIFFLAYAAAIASTEGAERAMIGDLAPRDQQGTAFGLYHMLSGILALPGALLFGALWQWFGMSAAYLCAAALTTLMVGFLLRQNSFR